MRSSMLALRLSSVIIFSTLMSSVSAHSVHARHAKYLDRLHQREGDLRRQDAQYPTGVSVPPLAQITESMATQTSVPLSSVWAAGATPTIAGAPNLPQASTITIAGYPKQDAPPPTNSTQVAEWLKELDGYNIPDINVTVDGSCASDPAMAANGSAAGTCWWTCGQCSRPTDITVCPDKMTWGVSYDDGPSPDTARLLNYLDEEDIKATFFVVGSRVPGRADILQSEYMSGHMISVHTWSHTPLTSQTNAEIVAELGWTRQIIKDAIGVTPNTMRPPYGDIDDRVRAISLAMGLRPIIWTSYGEDNFDTNDWKIWGGTATGNSSLVTFESILLDAQNLTTGFIVLEHDLYPQTVDLAIGYILPEAQSHQPPFNMMSINECYGLPAAEAYMETASTSPFRATDAGLLVASNNTQPNPALLSSATASATATQGPGGLTTIGVAGTGVATGPAVPVASGKTTSGAMGSVALPSGMGWAARVVLAAAVMLGAAIAL